MTENTEKIDWSKFDPTFNYEFLNVDCPNCKENYKLNEINEGSICPNCKEIITIPITIE
jgi:predicted Zn-ribbon and HTH transcriptional regulator